MRGASRGPFKRQLEYRAVQRAQLKDEDFRLLSKEAKALWWVLVLELRKYTIGLLSRDSLAGDASMTATEVEQALQELEAGRWIIREESLGMMVVWLRNRLRHEFTLAGGVKNASNVLLFLLESPFPRWAIFLNFLEYHTHLLSSSTHYEAAVEHFARSHRAPDRVSDTPPDRVSDTPPDRVSDTPPDRSRARVLRRDTGDRRQERLLTTSSVDEDQCGRPRQGTMTTEALLGVWQQRFPTLTERDRNQNRAAAVAILTERSQEEIMAAVVGIEQLFPFDAKGGRPWNLRDLYRHFAKAVSASQNHPDVKSRRAHEEFMALTEGMDD